MKADF